MKKLLLSCEIEIDESTGNVTSNVKNIGHQTLVPMAIANLCYNYVRNSPQVVPSMGYEAFLRAVFGICKDLDRSDMTIIDVDKLAKNGGGVDHG